MPVQDISCIYSTVRNTTGGRRKFGFLPPHGRELAANEEFTVFGNIQESIMGIDRPSSRRNITAFENALATEDLVIVNTPNPILTDRTGASKMIRIDGNGNVTTDDPCWTSASA